MDELHSWDIKGDQMEGKSRVSRSIIDELHSWITKDIKWKVKVVLVKVSRMNFIREISKEIK